MATPSVGWVFIISCYPGSYCIPGGLVFGNTFAPNLQYHEWASFIGDAEFCMRACTGKSDTKNLYRS